MKHYDIVIKNGQIYDGTGNAPYQADIAILDGKIAAIEPSMTASAERTLDAEGKIVTPGFVDVHTHYDGQATWDNHLAPSSNLGTTTVVMGNCGVGFAPCRQEDHDVLIKLMEGVEEIPETAMSEGLPWDWESFPEYLDSLDKRPRDIDVAALLPHGPLRVFVMGDRAVNREPATEADIEAMKVLLKEGVEAGAVGFSTSRTLVHRSADGNLVPTYKAATRELKSLGESLSGQKGHVFQLISDWEDPQDEFSILKEVSEKTGAKGTFTLLHLDNEPDLWEEQLSMVESAQSEGLDIRGQVLSRPVGMMMGIPSSMNPFYRRPSYMALDDLPWETRLERLKDPETKGREFAMFGIFSGPIGVTDGKFVLYYYPPDWSADGLREYTLAPHHMIVPFSVDELRTSKIASPFNFTKGCPLLSIAALPDAPRVPMNDGKSFANFDTALYDLLNDPKQENPIVNEEVTQNLLKGVTEILIDHDAPSEMYDWYNLKLVRPA